MPNLSELQLKDDNQKVDWDNIGEQRSGFTPPPQPGDGYIWQLPADLSSMWNVVNTQKGDRVSLSFFESGLVCVASPNGFTGSAFTGSISNVERNRARKGDPEQFASDLQYLYRDGLGGTEKPKGQIPFANAVSAIGSGKKFGSGVEWNAYCNPNKIRYIDNGEGGSVEDPGGAVGCGARTYQKNIPREADGSYARSFQCQCGAMLLANANLVRFKQVQQ